MSQELPVGRPWGLAFAWFVATALGVALCGFVFHFPGALPPNNGTSFNLNPTGALVNGIGTGLVVGRLQAWLLRRRGFRFWRWFAASGLALPIAHAFGDLLPDSASLALMAGLGGALLGAAQWWAAAWPLCLGILWTTVTSAPDPTAGHPTR